MPAESKIVVVLGASGRQGGSTARQLLLHKKYHVRAVGRDVTNPNLVALKSLGAELATANFDEPKSLSAAFHGAYAIFGNTNFNSTRSVDAERQQGRNIVDAAAAVPTLKHFIWSGAPDVVKMSGGKYKNVIQLQAKAAVTGYLKSEHPELAEKTTEAVIPPYFENWILLPGLYGPLQTDDKFTLSLPVAPETFWPAVPVADIGKIMLAILESPEQTLAKTVNGAFQMMNMSQMLAQWGEVFGKPVEYEKISPEAFEARNTAAFARNFGGEESAEMFVKAASEHMQLMEDVTTGKAVYENVLQMHEIVGNDVQGTSWADYLKETKSKQ